ncbi:hypothetical protein FBY00_13161 [Pseudomonas sp. SJZ075]|nr:hypothetical protein FBY00_13161 [Pseudomonas sp. SJZ075]TWC28110.1 hypothetical protein FBY02_1331 [Pseudomonas sp. SJZ078]TWC47844.1 hypothetical protein FBY11_1311 [Pseudomonas sp. SJZ124]
MCRRLREQARSHWGLWRMQRLRAPKIQCGSEPARESGVSAIGMLNVPTSSRASPLPLGSVAYAKAACAEDPVWERACSRKRCVCHRDVDCADVFASKPAPTRVCGVCKGCVHRRSSVGASLLAMASARAPLTCPGTPASAWPRRPPCLPSDPGSRMLRGTRGARNARLRTGSLQTHG